MEPYFGVKALSASLAKQILKSPAHAKASIDNPTQPTASMQFGTVVHGLVLEPHRQDLYVVKRQNWTTKEGKAEKADLEATGLPILSIADEARALRVRDAVLAHPLASQILDECKTREQEIYWTGNEGVPHKAKIDACKPGLILDLKTTTDASPREFSRSALSYGYHIQAANYCAAHEKEYGRTPSFVFVACETDRPFNVSLFMFDDEAVEEGRRLMRKAARLYKQCTESGDWPGYQPGVNRIALPEWMKPSLEELDF